MGYAIIYKILVLVLVLMKKRIGIGIAGFGNMGRTHAFSAESLKFFYDCGFEPYIAGISASTEESAAKYAERYSYPRAFSDFEELISCDEVDVVDICTPNVYHYSQLLKAIDAGKNIYCEKPLTVTYEEALDIAERSEKVGIIGGVVFNTRFLLPVIRAKEIIESGRLGNIISFDVKFLHSSAMDTSRTGWKQDKTVCGGGVLFDLGSHAVDLVRYLCGDFSSVFGRSQIAFPERTSYRGESGWKTNADEAFYLACTLKNGAEGNITVGKIFSGTNDDFSFEIYGTEGHVSFSLMEPNWLYYYDSKAENTVRGVTRIECVGRYPAPATGFPGQKAPVGWIRGHIGSMFNYLSHVCEGVAPSPSFRDAAEVQKILEVSYKSAERGTILYV